MLVIAFNATIRWLVAGGDFSPVVIEAYRSGVSAYVSVAGDAGHLPSSRWSS